jgi:predicted regulator of Ras-like GTPase activity (Roadblock/LC7/MglB family)
VTGPARDAFVLAETLTVPGVVAVALVDAGGAVRASLESEPPSFADAGPLVAAALAASRVLGDFVGGDHQQTVIEYGGGPLVLTPLGTDGGILVLRLSSIDDLGRVRFELPRLVARLTGSH